MIDNEALVSELVEITFPEKDDFLKIRETLSRIGVASRKDNELFQSCHILHKRGKYYIVHFKELFALDGKETNFNENDISRRNSIASLLGDWGLIEIMGTAESVSMSFKKEFDCFIYYKRISHVFNTSE